MTARHNTCVNPACKVDASGWTGASTPTRVTGLAGMNRTTGARYTAGGYTQTPVGAASPGDVVTMSLDVLTEVFDDPSVDVYFFVTRSAGGDAQVGAFDSTTLTNNVVKRLSITRTCPANTTGAYLIVDGVNMVISPTSYTALLIEVSPIADSYFDGDSPGASWDGANGLSASTLSGEITQPISPASETDAAQPLGRAKGRAVGQAGEADTAQPVGRTKTRALGIATTAEVAQPIGRLKTRAIGTVAAVETAQPLARAKARTIGVAGEADTAQPLGGAPASSGVGPRYTSRTPVGRHLQTTPAGRSL